MEREEKMTVDERYKYLRRMQKRYRKGGREERSRLLDEMEFADYGDEFIRIHMQAEIINRNKFVLLTPIDFSNFV